MRLFLLLCFYSQIAANVSALYLTWYGDPTSTMTIHWHTPVFEKSDTIYLYDGQWQEITGAHDSYYYINIHTSHLSSLKPDHEYQFRIGNYPTIYKFKTAPATLESPLRFVIGGDADYTTKIFRKMNQTIVKKDPLFCVIGGDIAYAVRTHPFQLSFSAFNRWVSFLSIWKEQMITPSGRLIPMVLAIGNHDLTEETTKLFFTLFPIPNNRLYRSLDFGNYMNLILLDTEHFAPIEGEQTTWLENTLKTGSAPFTFAVYHEAAYPSHYPFDGIIPQKIRANWCPLFEKHHITAAFEHHNHTYKKTHRIANNKIDPNGIIYFGDGCWGAPPRKTNDMWYLAQRGRKNNVYLIDLEKTKAHIQAINLNGEPLDTTEITQRLFHQTVEHP